MTKTRCSIVVSAGLQACFEALGRSKDLRYVRL